MANWSNPTTADLDRLTVAILNSPAHYVILKEGQRDGLDARFNPVAGQVVACGLDFHRCVKATDVLDDVTCELCKGELVGV